MAIGRATRSTYFLGVQKYGLTSSAPKKSLPFINISLTDLQRDAALFKIDVDF
jgi:hypothetical protein